MHTIKLLILILKKGTIYIKIGSMYNLPVKDIEDFCALII